MMIPEPAKFPKAPEALEKNIIEAFKNCKSITTTSIMQPDYTVTVCAPDPEPIQELHNCNNCGGTVDEEGYCRYCGSRVYFFGEYKPKFYNTFGFGF